jgi:hypothetical protein
VSISTALRYLSFLEIHAVFLIIDYILKSEKIISKRNVKYYFLISIPLYLYIMITNYIIREGISPRGFELLPLTISFSNTEASQWRAHIPGFRDYIGERKNYPHEGEHGDSIEYMNEKKYISQTRQ